MQLGIGPHLDDADLEQYAMGILPETRLEAFEEHFLACDSCQDRLLEMEAFVNAMRSASPKLRAARSSRWRKRFYWPRPVWAGAVALGLILLAGGSAWRAALLGHVETSAVLLQSSRGIEGLAIARAAAGRPLSLQIDLTELPALSSYRLEVVNATGKPVFAAVAAPRQNRIAQPLSKGLAAGQYYVRLYADEKEMLREFSLRIE